MGWARRVAEVAGFAVLLVVAPVFVPFALAVNLLQAREISRLLQTSEEATVDETGSPLASWRCGVAVGKNRSGRNPAVTWPLARLVVVPGGLAVHLPLAERRYFSSDSSSVELDHPRLQLSYTHNDGRTLQATFSLTSRYDIETLLREAGWLPRRPALDRRP